MTDFAGFYTSDYRGQQATKEPRETFQLHVVGLDPRPRGLYPDDPVRVAWETRQALRGDARKIADLKALGVERVSLIEMRTPEIYQEPSSFFPVARTIIEGEL